MIVQETTSGSAAENRWLHRFAVLTALATLGLIGIGGLVTSHGAGMAVPDWPTSYGYNMFALPLQFWIGGVFYEHTHRLWASVVGLLVVALTRWLGGRASRLPLAIIGAAEVVAGFGIFQLWPHLKGTGHFLTGIGGVVLLAALVWVRNEPASRTLTRLGRIAFGLVQFQGLLGGLRVVLFRDEIGIFHAALAQVFFVLLCAISVLTSRWWQVKNIQHPISPRATDGHALDVRCFPPVLRRLFLFTTILIFLQLILGATMRHQHAGLAIPDFPLAYGKLWPATDADSVTRYNQQRIETTSANPITAFQIQLQMVHRIVAVLILCAVAACAWMARGIGAPGTASARSKDDSKQAEAVLGVPIRRLSFLWLGMILAQVALGAATVWSNKAADLATAHVLMGALSLANGAVLCIMALGFNHEATRPAVVFSRADSRPDQSSPVAATISAQ